MVLATVWGECSFALLRTFVRRSPGSCCRFVRGWPIGFYFEGVQKHGGVAIRGPIMGAATTAGRNASSLLQFRPDQQT